jgi:hypothetical protein
MLMDEMNLGLDDSLMSPTEGFEGCSADDTLGTLGAAHSPFSSGFDAEHPMPTYEELRNAGFSDYLAHNIAEGLSHSYSDKELFHVLYESDDPVAAYNEMMEDKAQVALDKADALIADIENSGLLGSSAGEPIGDDVARYNETSSLNDTTQNEQELGLADCWPLCKALTGSVTNNADYGFHA